MNAPLKTDALPEWRLDDLYAGRDDPRIAADLAAAKAANDALVALKGAFVAARAKPPRLGALIEQGVGLYETATNGLWSVGAYGALAASTARDDPAWAKFESDIRAKSSAIAAESIFFTLELNELEEAEIDAALAAHPAVEPILQIQSFYRMANALSLARGYDPDSPPNLNKVTETV